MITYSTDQHFVQPVTQYNDATGLWTLKLGYRFEWWDKKYKRRERLTFPAGEEYDQASVPQPLWGLARPNGPWEGPSYIHDNIYKHLQYGGSFPKGMYEVQTPSGDWVEGPKRNRAWADWLLAYSATCTKRISAWEANKYRLAVTLYPENWFKGF